MRRVEFTREAMYAKVWSLPIVAIAKEVGVSDLLVSRTCRAAGIPLPPAGYWAAVRAGKTRPMPPLPAAGPGQAGAVHFEIWDNAPTRPRKLDPKTLPRVDVPAVLIDPHPLVVRYKAVAEKAREHDGLLVPNADGLVDMRTSRACIDRALLLLDTLIKEFERRGLRIRTDAGRRHGETMLQLKEGEISFRIAELCRQVPPPKEESRDLSYVLAVTGEFSVTFGLMHGEGVRFFWRDKSGRPLERQLPEVMASIPGWEAALRKRRLDREEQAARHRKEEEQRQAETRRRELLRKQRTRLVGHLEAWERASQLRQFVAAVEATGNDTTATRQWLTWAKEQADLLDPLQRDLATVLSLEVGNEYYYPGYGRQLTDWWGER